MKEKDETLLLIDGSSMLVTNYWATIPQKMKFEKDEENRKKYYKDIMHAPDGRYTNAVYTTLKMLLKIIKSQDIKYVAVAFDKSRNTFRRKIYSEYKANRGKTPKPLSEQFGTMINVLNELGICVLEMDEFEADDIVGTLSTRFSKIMPVKIITKDHDYYQLASDNTKLWMMQSSEKSITKLINKYGIQKNTVTDKIYEFDKNIVKSETGVYPKEIIDLKAIIGDTSDNIPGVKGVEKPAPLLIAYYKTLENLYKEIDDCMDAKEEKNLSDFWKNTLGISRSPLGILKKEKDNAFLSKTLSKIKCDVPLNIYLFDMYFKLDSDKLDKVCADLNIKHL